VSGTNLFAFDFLDLNDRERFVYCEGLVHGLDEGRIKLEALDLEHEQQIRTLWLVILGLRHDFTWSPSTRSKFSSRSSFSYKGGEVGVRK
jgi:hypothetical protein